MPPSSSIRESRLDADGLGLKTIGLAEHLPEVVWLVLDPIALGWRAVRAHHAAVPLSGLRTRIRPKHT